jgi:beta-xylosidase
MTQPIEVVTIPPWIDPAAAPGGRVDALPDEMTSAERIAQFGSCRADTRDSAQIIAPMQDRVARERPPHEKAAEHGIGVKIRKADAA